MSDIVRGVGRNGRATSTQGAREAPLREIISRSVGSIHVAHSDNDLAPAIENAMDTGFAGADRAIHDM